jgi:glycosyltransferase involved in cell wall biosynthesis
LDANPDVEKSGMNPLVHYIRHGKMEGREASPEKPDYSKADIRAVKVAEPSGSELINIQKQKKNHLQEIQLIRKSDYFDEKYYLATYPDVKKAGMDPAVHYYHHGWKEGRNPGSHFETQFYLDSYKDVRESNINPLLHYIQYGIKENRVCEYTYESDNEFEDTFESALSTERDLSDPIIKLLAFYLPQFHPIPENDKWWGKGFTEWSNMTTAVPQFEGHYQPRRPLDLGYYDLRVPETMKEQIEMAKNFGVYGFCFYYYWFDGKRLLEKPLDMFLKHKEWDFNFCVCWANENWTRRWDGQDKEILIAQNHSPEDDMAFIEDVSKYLQDPRYIRINGKPLLIIYRPQIYPDIKASVKKWKEYYMSVYQEDLCLGMVQTFGKYDPNEFGFDYAIEFPPHNISPNDITSTLNTTPFIGKVFDTESIVQNSVSKLSRIDYNLFRGVMLNWDNTPRKGIFGNIYLNNTPEVYKAWLKEACEDTLKNKDNDSQKLVFINAWNEWAEGAHLEPDQKYGYAYLNATRKVLEELKMQPKKFPNSGKIVFISHDAYFAGAQLVLKDTVEWLTRNTGIKIKILFLGDGELRQAFSTMVDTLFLSDFDGQDHISNLIEQFVGDDVDLFYLNSVASGSIIKLLKSFNIPILTHVHELKKSIDVYASNYIDDVLSFSDHFIACSDAVSENLLTRHKIDLEKISTIHSYVKNQIKNEVTVSEKEELKKKLGIPIGKRIILGMGLGLFWRKGADIFIDVCEFVSKYHKSEDFLFLWIGEDFEDGNIKSYGKWKDHETRIETKGLNSKIEFIGKKSNVREYLLTGDVFLLPSREDPFPLVCLEAADCFLPVICFEKAGGMPEFVKDDAGFVIPFEDTKEMALKTIHLLNHESERREKGRIAHQRFVDNHSVNVSLAKVLNVTRKIGKIPPLVSVIVPNYNYEDYLEKRLDTIFNQTFKDFEVIIMDDASSDNSIRIIEKYKNRPNTIVEINETNIGSVFHQWEKGIQLAKGRYIWIAEADDYSDTTFLEHLLTAFSYPDVNLAYCNSHMVDADDNIEDNFYLNCGYYEGVGYDSSKWKNNYKNRGIDEIENVLAIKNTIPNCSAVIFRKEVFLNTDFSFIKNLNCSHDWLSYVNIIKDGSIYYCSKALNYHRRHENSVIAVNAKDYKKTLKEYYLSHQYILQNFYISEVILQMMRKLIFNNLSSIWDGITKNDIKKIYNVKELNQTQQVKNLKSMILPSLKTNSNLYIHIGLHKTGTTAIQTFLCYNRNILLNKGIYYPEVPDNDPAPLQQRYLITLIRQNKKAEFIDFFKQSVSKVSNVVISSECFLEEESFIKWFEALKLMFDNIKIIVYVRRQDEWVESVYKFYIRYHGSRVNIKFDEWVNGFLNNRTIWYYNLHWNELIKNLAGAFRDENIIVKLYHRDKFYMGSLYNDFMRILNIQNFEGFTNYHDDKINVRIRNRNECEFYRISNPFFTRQEQSVLISHIHNYFEDDTHPLLSPEDRQRIMNYVQESNEKLGDIYFNGNKNIFRELNLEEYKDWKPYKGLSKKFINKILKHLTDHKYDKFREYLRNYNKEV